MDYTNAIIFLMKEFAFQWHLTNLCNLRCRHCYQDDFTDKDDLPGNVIKDIIKKISDELYDYDIQINLTGGEPFLRADLFELMECLEGTVNITGYNIITNGLVIKEDDIKKLNQMSKLKEVKMSLEHSNPIINDRIRGRNAFERCMANFDVLKRNLNKKIVLMYTVAGYNYRDIVNFGQGESGLLDFAEEAGADAVILERFIPLGRGKLLMGHYLSEEEWREVIKGVIIFAGLNIDDKELRGYRAFYIGLGHAIDVLGAVCNIGEGTMALMPNGDIYPCRRLPRKIGNILRNNIRDVMPLSASLKNEGLCSALKYAVSS